MDENGPENLQEVSFSLTKSDQKGRRGIQMIIDSKKIRMFLNNLRADDLETKVASTFLVLT